MYATIQQLVMTLAYALHDKHQFHQENGMDVWNGTKCRCHSDTLHTSNLSYKGSSEKRTETRTTVRYHCGGWSEEVNSCILIISYMVYL